MSATADEGVGAGGSPRWVGPARLAVGFGQGSAVYLLVRLAILKWADAHEPGFAILAAATLFTPLILLAGLGRMRPAVLATWALAAAALLAALLGYGWWRDPLGDDGAARTVPDVELWLATPVLLYALHHLIEPADEERTLRPSYRLRFEGTTRHAFQLVLAGIFCSVFGGVLQLGAGLFLVIGVPAPARIVGEPWFIAPTTAMAFAAAVHVTDVRPGLIRGVRTVGLTLLAWLLPLTAGLEAAFLLALPFTGLGPLWSTHLGALLLLTAAGTLLALINAAYQDGREPPARVLRWAGTLGALQTPVLAGLSAWSSGVRIAQYGLTAGRVWDVAVTAVIALYAIGYAHAALRRGRWMRGLEGTNVAAAYAIVALLLLLLSPVLDPARLAVADQVHRLQTGRLPKAGLDWSYLRFRGARFGREAVALLAHAPDAKVAAEAALWRDKTSPFAIRPQPHSAPRSGMVIGPGAPPPADFLRQRIPDPNGGAECLVDDTQCRVLTRDLDQDGTPEVLILQANTTVVFARGPDGVWRKVGRYDQDECGAARDALARGDYRAVPPRLPDLEAAGQRLIFRAADDTCAGSLYRPAPILSRRPR